MILVLGGGNNMDSILTSVKKALGIAEDYTHFDPDIIMHINSVFMILQQMGVGSLDGFSIASDNETWDEFTDDNLKIEAVKSYMYLKVRLMFDPPTGSILDSMNRIVSELEWRLNIAAS